MVSVIVPVYNTESYIEKCVKSILEQTNTDLELILIDDGSTDQSGMICDALSLIDDRVRTFHKKNSGVAAARNVGLEVARGEFITFIDSDDYVHHQMLEVLCYSIEKERADLAMVYIEEVDNDTAKDLVINKNNYIIKKTQEEYWRMRYSDKKTCAQLFMCTAKLYRRSSIIDLRFPEGRKQEDLFWFGEYVKQINKVVVYSYPMYYYYQRFDSNMHSPSYVNFRDTLQADSYLLELCKECFPDSSELEDQLFYERYFHHLNVINYLDLKEAKLLKKYFRKRYALDKKFLLRFLTKGQRLILFFLNFETVQFIIKMSDYHYDLFEYIGAHFK